MSDTLDTNSIFLFAVFVAIACATTTSNGLRPSEAFIMLQLCFGYLLSVLSISGLRLTLLNNPTGLNFTNWIDEIKENLKPAPALLQRSKQLNALSSSYEKAPSDLEVPLKKITLLRYLENCRLVSVGLGLYDMAVIEFFEYLLMYWFERQLGATESEDDPVQAYVRQRLRISKEKRLLVREIMRSKILSLGLKSQFKHDEISWLGICWRSLLVGGIAVYNVWFWFRGTSTLESDSCPTYIFLFCKVDAYGSAGTFYRVLSAIFMVYSGTLLWAFGLVMLSFLGTVLRSLFIYIIVIPYAKFLVLLASLGVLEALDRANVLDKFEWDKLLGRLDVPSLRLLLSAFAYVSSNPKETDQELTAVKKGELSTV
jgi:hypothetical protein